MVLVCPSTSGCGEGEAYKLNLDVIELLTKEEKNAQELLHVTQMGSSNL